MASNKNACKMWVTDLNKAWAQTAGKRKQLLKLSQSPNPTDEQCDDLIKWAANVHMALLLDEEE